jgi:hypothetical protein
MANHNDYNVSTTSNAPETFGDLVGGIMFGGLAQLLGVPSDGYTTTITDSSGKTIATGHGSTAKAAQDDAYTSIE